MLVLCGCADGWCICLDWIDGATAGVGEGAGAAAACGGGCEGGGGGYEGVRGGYGTRGNTM
jgi:hypothetical protein